jgi:hypothetical protein
VREEHLALMAHLALLVSLELLDPLDHLVKLDLQENQVWDHQKVVEKN